MADSTDGAGVTDPRDTDVLCGRGGAALRHPGNQTYRRLVNLNKGLYITCLKTEKLKISRSIVAAIREQNGRFLEKDSKSGQWFDIGDKKAVEKTSQALREGQPRLKKKIVEMGGGAAGTAAFMEAQYGHTGLYDPEQVGLTSANIVAEAKRNSEEKQKGGGSMQPPSGSRKGDSSTDGLLQRLSIHDDRTDTRSATGSSVNFLGSQLSLLSGHSFANGSHISNFSLTSDGSFRRTLANLASLPASSAHSNSMNFQGLDNTSFASMDVSGHTPIPLSAGQAGLFPGGASIASASSNHSNRDKLGNVMDRRRVFAKMKYERPPSTKMPQGVTQQHFQDGSDVNMAESNVSLYSNISSMSGANMSGAGMYGINMPGATVPDSTFSSAQRQPYVPPKPIVETAKVVDHSRGGGGGYSEAMGAGSRHSIMSGLSRISDTSIDHSIFSDLSRKIGNVSTRSLALSEISAIDMQERDTEEAPWGIGRHLATPNEEAKAHGPTVEYQI